MRRVAWGLLLLFAFAIPWEYSLDLGEPLGNVARVVGLLLLLAAVPAVLQAGSMRTPGALQWMVLAFYLWFCCTYFWTIEPVVTLERMRANFQVMMTVWLVWEFAESPQDLRVLLRAFVAGSCVLAVLTLANFASPQTIAEGQVRFAAIGQDPNDVARFLDIGFPLAAFLLNSEPRWPARLLALGYMPLGLIAVLLTASRGGFLAAVVALGGCGILLARSHAKGVLVVAVALPAIAAALWFTVPHEIFERLATIPEQLQSGDLNQRMNIWTAGWHAFVQAPLLGSGAGSFVSVAGTAPMDTAHNTALAIAVNGGLLGLFLAVAIVVLAARSILQTHGALRLALTMALLVWVITAMVATVEESRTTWLLLALIALAGRLALEQPERLAACFPDSAPATACSEVPAPAV
ncbi:MAG: O-antigen ligase family protein [Terracidiphilus sp.]|nr:O-antigen ligase family protein [Terracidiphilus sp.]